jgi:Chlorophyll A-B binding protein
MIKTGILASLLASAAAFAPSQAPKASTDLAAAMDSMRGSIDFRGKEFRFDPLSLSETYEPFLPFFRESELRHGRTAMLAVVGFVAPDFVRIPGDMYSFQAVPKAADAHDVLMGKGPMGQLLLWIGLFDIVVTAPAIVATMQGEREPGGEYCGV